MSNTDILEKIREKTENFIKEKNYEIYDIEYKKDNSSWVLRFFLDNSSKSITLDECANLSHQIGDILDETFPELPAYNLEVSSPGLDRLLKNDSDFMWAMGKTLKIKFTNDDNKKEVIEARLLNLNHESLELQLSKKSNILIKKATILEARRVMIFDEIVPKKPQEPILIEE
ncbi:MAG: hypothetical protein AABZ74_09445 [Cyanobacteriota bacterium]